VWSNLVVRDFIDGWYKGMSPFDKDFPNAVRAMVAKTIGSICNRFMPGKLDGAEVLLHIAEDVCEVAEQHLCWFRVAAGRLATGEYTPHREEELQRMLLAVSAERGHLLIHPSCSKTTGEGETSSAWNSFEDLDAAFDSRSAMQSLSMLSSMILTDLYGDDACPPEVEARPASVSGSSRDTAEGAEYGSDGGGNQCAARTTNVEDRLMWSFQRELLASCVLQPSVACLQSHFLNGLIVQVLDQSSDTKEPLQKDKGGTLKEVEPPRGTLGDLSCFEDTNADLPVPQTYEKKRGRGNSMEEQDHLFPATPLKRRNSIAGLRLGPPAEISKPPGNDPRVPTRVPWSSPSTPLSPATSGMLRACRTSNDDEGWIYFAGAISLEESIKILSLFPLTMTLATMGPSNPSAKTQTLLVRRESLRDYCILIRSHISYTAADPGVSGMPIISPFAYQCTNQFSVLMPLFLSTKVDLVVRRAYFTRNKLLDTNLILPVMSTWSYQRGLHIPYTAHMLGGGKFMEDGSGCLIHQFLFSLDDDNGFRFRPEVSPKGNAHDKSGEQIEKDTHGRHDSGSSPSFHLVSNIKKHIPSVFP
jgi:hypothetical protein